jgi:hypothetical protein
VRGCCGLAADDPALHVVGLKLHDRHRRLGRVPGREPLHADRQDVAHAPLGIALGRLLDLTDAACRIVAGLVLDLLEQQLLGACRRQAGDPLERVRQLLPFCAQALPLALQLGLATRQGVLTAGECGGPLGGVLVSSRSGRGRPRDRRRCGMHAGVQHSGDHDSHRDQRCGTDDVHGRSSRSLRRLSVLGATEWPVRARRMPAELCFSDG